MSVQAKVCQSLFENKKTLAVESNYSERSSYAFSKLNYLKSESDVDFFVNSENQKTQHLLKEYVKKYQKIQTTSDGYVSDKQKDFLKDLDLLLSHSDTAHLIKASLGFVTFLSIDSKIQKNKKSFLSRLNFFNKQVEMDQIIENDLSEFYQKRLWERAGDLKHSKLMITFSNITVNEMIYFEALGIAPIQLVLIEKNVHNEIFDPLNFAAHDLGHALVYRGASKLPLMQRLILADEFVKYFKSIADPVKARVAQFLVFYLMHEKGIVIDNINKKPHLKMNHLYRQFWQSEFGEFKITIEHIEKYKDQVLDELAQISY